MVVSRDQGKHFEVASVIFLKQRKKCVLAPENGGEEENQEYGVQLETRKGEEPVKILCV